MVKVLVGSKNPAKIDSVKEAFSHYFKELEVIGVDVESDVPEQPINNQTFEGAQNRAKALHKINLEHKYGASFFVGVEGGIIHLYSRWFSFAVSCIMDETGKTGFGISPNFELSEAMSTEILQGVELGVIAERLTGEQNVNHKGGIIGFLTKGIIDRRSLQVPALVTALVPFLNKEIYF